MKDPFASLLNKRYFVTGGITALAAAALMRFQGGARLVEVSLAYGGAAALGQCIASEVFPLKFKTVDRSTQTLSNKLERGAVTAVSGTGVLMAAGLAPRQLSLANGVIAGVLMLSSIAGDSVVDSHTA